MRLMVLTMLLAACGPSAEQPGEVPVNDAELSVWVEDGNYLDWASESEVHTSSGPHFGGVKVFVNDELEESLSDGGDPHPIASAAIKELYGDGDDLLGWTVMVKVEDGSADDSWFFWEQFEGDKLIEGVGQSACTGCHGAGVDLILTAFPLQ